MKKLTLSLLIFVPIIVFGQIINIPADYPNIQDGIDAANDGDTVLVQPGIYMENIIINGKNITLASLYLTTYDTSYISQTIIDGDTTDRVVVMLDLSEMSALIGFTIRNGDAHDNWGGGIYISAQAAPMISNVIISNNTAARGGGICCMNATLYLFNSVIKDNLGIDQAGGIKVINSNAIIENCAIVDNYSLTAGAIHYNAGGNQAIDYVAEITSCLISNNTAETATAGLYIGRYGTNTTVEALVEDCDFIDNTADNYGALQIRGDSVFFSLENCKFIGNSVSRWAGAVGITQPCEGEMINCLFASNIAGTGGEEWNAGGLSVWGMAEVALMNCTFADNQASYGAGLTVGGNGMAYATNCIFWGNNSGQIALADFNEMGGTLYMDYCDLQYGVDSVSVDPFSELNDGDHIFNDDPLFVGSGDDPYALSSGSICIDNGYADTTGSIILPYDILGNVRIWDGNGSGTAIIDLGPYEFGAPVWVGIDDNPRIQSDEEIALYVYPNPCSDHVRLRFEISDKGSTKCDLYSISGKKVRLLMNEEMRPGTYETELNVSDLPAGIYFIRLQSGKQIEITKMVVK